LGVRAGISDALAEVILIGAVIAVVVGVASWLTGVWGGEATNVAERFFVYPDSVLVVDGGVRAELHIVSDIKPSVEVIKVVLEGSQGTPSSVNIIRGGPVSLTSGGFIVPAGTEAWVTVAFPGLSPGDVTPMLGSKVEVLIYTNTGYVYKGMLTVRYGS